MPHPPKRRPARAPFAAFGWLCREFRARRSMLMFKRSASLPRTACRGLGGGCRPQAMPDAQSAPGGAGVPLTPEGGLLFKRHFTCMNHRENASPDAASFLPNGTPRWCRLPLWAALPAERVRRWNGPLWGDAEPADAPRSRGRAFRARPLAGRSASRRPLFPAPVSRRRACPLGTARKRFVQTKKTGSASGLFLARRTAHTLNRNSTTSPSCIT